MRVYWIPGGVATILGLAWLAQAWKPELIRAGPKRDAARAPRARVARIIGGLLALAGAYYLFN